MRFDEVEERLDKLRTRLEERKAVGYRDVVELIDVMLGGRDQEPVLVEDSKREPFDTTKSPEAPTPGSSTTEGAVGNEAPQPGNNDHASDGA